MHLEQRLHLAFELVKFVHLHAELIIGVDISGHVEIDELQRLVGAKHDIRSLRITVGRFHIEACGRNGLADWPHPGQHPLSIVGQIGIASGDDRP
ncbi:hypothetical protein D3C71_858080 [compost metagenome]